MLEGALGRLFRDLDAIGRSRRSAYENALHSELACLFVLVEQAMRLHQGRPEAPTRGVNFPGAIMGTRIDMPGIAGMVVDLTPAGGDITRLHCDEPKCPNKRR